MAEIQNDNSNKVTINGEQISGKIEAIFKGAVQIYSKESLVSRLKSGKTLKIKMGADPSRPDLHLGHTVILRKLRLFQELGHEINFVIGDFTGMIGDPTGRSKTRPALTLRQTRESGESYYRQVTKILDPDRTKILYNSEWLNQLNFSDVIKLASRCTLAQILAREDFRNRYEGSLPISLHELLYPLAQGYDSVALGSDVEIGGTDQTFNLLMGRALQSDYGQTPQEVLTYPLLVGLDGKEKMSKSLNNYIGLDEPAGVMFEKAMKVPDGCLLDYFTLTAGLDEPEALALIQKDIRQAHFAYAAMITKMYHGNGDADEAEKRYRRIACGFTPEGMPEVILTGKEFPGGKIRITELLRRVGFAASLGEARRNIAGKGVRVNGNTVEDAGLELELFRPITLQFGKNRFCKVSLREEDES